MTIKVKASGQGVYSVLQDHRPVGRDGLTDAERAVRDSQEIADGRLPVEDDRERQRQS